MKKKLLAFILVVTSAIGIYSQSIPRATANMKIAWDQDGATLADVQSYRYTGYSDNNTILGIVLTATCTGTTSPFTCSAPFPVKTLGDRTIIVAAQLDFGNGLFSPEMRSTAFAFRIVSDPSAPGNLRILR